MSEDAFFMFSFYSLARLVQELQPFASESRNTRRRLRLITKSNICTKWVKLWICLFAVNKRSSGGSDDKDLLPGTPCITAAGELVWPVFLFPTRSHFQMHFSSSSSSSGE